MSEQAKHKAAMKFDVINRSTGAVQFTAEIDCDDDASRSIKLGLAVRWAVKSGASLEGADLEGADLYGARLEGANFRWASLARASLAWASLEGASLAWARLEGADFYRADLYRANLEGANFRGARLEGARLAGAGLAWADLYRANLEGANFRGASGVNDYVKCVQIDTYPITYTADVIQIGCKRHTHQEWADFTDDQIRQMDGVKAVEWWAKYKAWLLEIIEICPAKPTGATP